MLPRRCWDGLVVKEDPSPQLPALFGGARSPPISSPRCACRIHEVDGSLHARVSPSTCLQLRHLPHRTTRAKCGADQADPMTVEPGWRPKQQACGAADGPDDITLGDLVRSIPVATAVLNGGFFRVLTGRSGKQARAYLWVVAELEPGPGRSSEVAEAIRDPRASMDVASQI